MLLLCILFLVERELKQTEMIIAHYYHTDIKNRSLDRNYLNEKAFRKYVFVNGNQMLLGNTTIVINNVYESPWYSKNLAFL